MTRLLAWLPMLWIASSLCCAKKIQVLPSERVVVDGVLFCKEPAPNWICTPSGNYKNMMDVIIECNEVLKTDFGRKVER